MKNHHDVGPFKNRLMISLLSLGAILVMAGQSYSATSCSTCHGMPPLDSADGSRNPATGAFKGSHQKHVDPGAVSADCVVCHSAASGYGMDHSTTSGNTIGISSDISGGTYSKGTSFSQSAEPETGSCSNVSCHADPYSSGHINTPDWGTVAGCSACHNSSPITATGPDTGSHSIPGHNAPCTSCHAAGTSTTTAPSTGHADGDIDVINGYPSNVIKHTAGTYTGTCSTATCHPNVYGTGSSTTPVWGTTGNGCSSCHTVAIGTDGPATGSHAAHAGKACIVCHAAGTTATTAPSDINGHIDGNIDIYYFNYPADVAKHSAGSYTGTCSTAYCHSNGRGSYTVPTWGGTSTGCNFCHPSLSGKHSVHTNLASAEYGNTADSSVAGSYNFGCGNCHPIALSNHINNVVDISLNSAHGGVLKSKNNVSNDTSGYTQTAGTSVTCAAAYCHSNGMASPTFYGSSVNWYEADYTGDKCARCHGNSPNTGGRVGSTAHKAHTVGIHVADIFNGVSRKLPIGGGETVNAAHGRNSRSTTINCNICHALTVTSFANDKNSECFGCHDGSVAPLKGNAVIADKTKHVNGAVDVSFIAQKIATKAQVADKAFAAYTAASNGAWVRNKGIYKTYTSGYDVTKTMLSSAPSYSIDSSCTVSCHSNKRVVWSDVVTCTSCHTRLR